MAEAPSAGRSSQRADHGAGHGASHGASGMGHGEIFDREIHVRGIAIFGIGLAILIVVSAVAMWGMFKVLLARQVAGDVPPSALVLQEGHLPVPQPHLQTTPEKDLLALRTREDSLLHSYGWVNEADAIARIPVDRAMELLLQGGLPTRAEPLPWTRPGTWRDPTQQRLQREGAP